MPEGAPLVVHSKLLRACVELGWQVVQPTIEMMRMGEIFTGSPRIRTLRGAVRFTPKHMY